MKVLTIILLLFCCPAYGQRKKYDSNDLVRKGDSLETLYAKDDQFKIVTDTLSLFTMDENDGWREMKLVTYYYHNPNRLRKISFRNGREGYYYFYFEEMFLRKVRVLKKGDFINLQYYFTTEDNKLTSSEIEKKVANNPQLKERYELLKLRKILVNKFKMLL